MRLRDLFKDVWSRCLVKKSWAGLPATARTRAGGLPWRRRAPPILIKHPNPIGNSASAERPMRAVWKWNVVADGEINFGNRDLLAYTRPHGTSIAEVSSERLNSESSTNP
jgi:hypothetical protein